ncbi:hypothetical protein MRX96_034188 [Rhipicephalus microplus]
MSRATIRIARRFQKFLKYHGASTRFHHTRFPTTNTHISRLFLGNRCPHPFFTHGSTLPQMQYTTGPLQPAPTLSYDPMGGYQVNRERLEPGYSPFPSQGQSAYPNDRMPPGILRHYVSRANDGSRRWQEKARALRLTQKRAAPVAPQAPARCQTTQAGRKRSGTTLGSHWASGALASWPSWDCMLYSTLPSTVAGLLMTV